MKNNKHWIKTAIISFFLVLVVPIGAQAVNLIPGNCLARGAPACGLEDLLQLFVNAYTIGIIYVGGVALLFIIIGGLVLLTSHGRQDRVDMGKQIISHTIIGVVVVMIAFFLVQFIQTQLFQVENKKYIVKSISDCTGKPDGTTCAKLDQSGTGKVQSVYACFQGICAMSKCEYNVKYKKPFQTSGYWRSINGVGDSKFCMDKDQCQPGTISENECPGDENFVCCFYKL